MKKLFLIQKQPICIKTKEIMNPLELNDNRVPQCDAPENWRTATAVTQNVSIVANV